MPNTDYKKPLKSASRCYSKEVSSFGTQINKRLRRFSERAVVNLYALVIIIVVLSIISAVAVIRMTNITGDALTLREEAIMRSLRKALNVYHAQHGRWYGSSAGEHPFDLLNNPPSISSDIAERGAGRHWYFEYWDSSLVFGWGIWCPHCTGFGCDSNIGSNWVYFYDRSWFDGAWYEPGEILEWHSKGH